jgi:hypothetical protein
MTANAPSLTHANRHAAGGPDELTPDAIGLAGVAVSGSYNDLSDTPVLSGLVYSIRYTGTQPLRATVAAGPTDTVMWITASTPAIGSGYAINDVDLWVNIS